MAVTYFGDVRSWNGEVPGDTFVAGGVVSQGDLVMINSSGKVVVAATSGSAIDSTTIASGLLGRARNATDAANQGIAVDLLVAYTYLSMPAYSTAPTLALMGVSPTTLYTGRNDSALSWSINLGVTTNGVFRNIGVDWDSDQPLVAGGLTAAGLNTGLRPPLSGYAAGQMVKVGVPQAYRFCAF